MQKNFKVLFGASKGERAVGIKNSDDSFHLLLVPTETKSGSREPSWQVEAEKQGGNAGVSVLNAP